MDKTVQAEIFQEFHDKLQWYIFEKVNDTYLAEDLCSDVLMKVYDKYDSFDSTKASLSTWIYTIARNTLIDYYRGRKVFEDVPEDVDSDSDIEGDVCDSESLDELADALEKLDERERDIVVLRYYKGITLKEIAFKLGISYAYVKILHNKALSELKDYMS